MEERCYRNLKNVKIPGCLLRHVGIEEVLPRLKERGIIPEDAELVDKFRLDHQDGLMVRYSHPSFSLVRELDMVPWVGVTAEELGFSG